MPSDPSVLADELFEHIRHGDDEHQAWLKRELDAFFALRSQHQASADVVERELWQVLRRHSIHLPPWHDEQGWKERAAQILSALQPAPVADEEAREVTRMRRIADDWRRPQLRQVEGANDFKIYGRTVADDIDKWADLITRQQAFRQAIDDELMCCHLWTPELMADPKKALAAIIQWNQQLALDPAVSEDARKLVERARREGKEAVLSWLRDRPATKPASLFADEAMKLADAFEQSEKPYVALEG